MQIGEMQKTIDRFNVCFQIGAHIVYSCHSCGDDAGEYTMSEQQAERWCKWNSEK